MMNYEKPDFIIPAISIHIAAEFLIKMLVNSDVVKYLPISKNLIKKIPNGFKWKKGQIFTSYANSICPDNCFEPNNICMKTKKTRLLNMFDFLNQINHRNIKFIVIKSKQLFPGVGGYNPKDLHMAFDKIKKNPKTIFAICTACKCHGVINLFSIG